ncbi:MAG: fimbrillin family protein [Bacteroidales bacterium]|nr:fimbrillin family protein [Bacteroidales bacterium]
MKSLTRYIVAFVLLCCFAGCAKLPDAAGGFLSEEICFSTAAEESGPDTKLGLKFWDSWVYPEWEDGDRVKIVKYSESGASGNAEYNCSISSGNYLWKSAAPLRWEEKAAHDFFVVYPASGTITPLSTPGTGTDPQARIQCEVTRNMSNGDPAKFYMVGASHADEPVSLVRFQTTPALSVFRFSITNKKAAGLRISSVNLLAWDEPYWTSSSQQMNLYGKYYVDLTASYSGWYYTPSVTYAGLAEAPAYKSMIPSFAKTMALNETASFTVYAIPQNYKRLVLTLTLTGAVSKEQKIDFRNTSNSSLGFEPFKKYDLRVTLQ